MLASQPHGVCLCTVQVGVTSARRPNVLFFVHTAAAILKAQLLSFVSVLYTQAAFLKAQFPCLFRLPSAAA